MKLLIVTPTLGAGLHLGETLRSVAGLGALARHVLVCPPDAAEALRRQAPTAEVIAEAPRGVYAALNRGLQASGEWDAWTWINDDDVLVPEGVRAAVSVLAAAPACDVVYGRVDYFSRRGSDLGPLPVEDSPARLPALFAAGVPALTQHGTLVRRAAAERLGPFDEHYRLAADFDYWVRAVAAGLAFTHVPQPVARYRLRPGQLSGDVAAVAAEIRVSAGRHFPGASAPEARLQFRLRHLPDLWRRWRLTGCLSSAALYRRAAQEDLKP